MKKLVFVTLLLFIAQSLLAQQVKKAPMPKVNITKAKAPTTRTTIKTLVGSSKSDTLNKTPKAIFLIKRAKVDADIGEPVLYPFERQLSNIYYDIPSGVIHNE